MAGWYGHWSKAGRLCRHGAVLVERLFEGNQGDTVLKYHFTSMETWDCGERGGSAGRHAADRGRTSDGESDRAQGGFTYGQWQ